jgi:hypothetical protein
MSRRIDLSPKSVEKILREMQADAAAGHLSDEDLVNRAFDDLGLEDRQRVDAHVATCGDCRDELARARAIAAEMNTEEQRPQVERLSNGFARAAGVKRPLAELLAALSAIRVPAFQTLRTAAPVALREVVVDAGASADGQFRWELIKGASSTLSGWIKSADDERLHGATIYLNTRPPRRTVLHPVAGELKATFTIDEHEWNEMRDGKMIARIVLADDGPRGVTG